MSGVAFPYYIRQLKGCLYPGRSLVVLHDLERYLVLNLIDDGWVIALEHIE